MPPGPAMIALDSLSLRIRQAFSSTLHDADWGGSRSMAKVLEEVSSVFDTALDPASRRSITKTLTAFRATQKLPTFLDMKYVCLGVTQPAGPDGWRLIDDGKLFPLLLQRVDGMTAGMQGKEAGSPPSRRFLKCFQGLLAGYFDYNIYSSDATQTGRQNWKELRAFLQGRLDLAALAEPAPRWVRVLMGHRDLLGDAIYERYGTALAKGDFLDLKSACECLLIPRNSWVWEVTVLVRIRAVCALDDGMFCRHLDQCLSMITRGTGIVLSDIVKKQCAALLLNRYAVCSSRKEHPQLLDAAVTVIGNPWADRAAWDALGLTDEGRTMVTAWLRRRLIRDYFRLLSAQGAGDRERLRSWLRFEPKIDDLWFALGPHAYGHESPEISEFRRLAGERVRMLENGGSPGDNALIVRIGDHVFVELSGSGSTCTVFESRSLPFDLDRKWIRIGTRTQPSGLRHIRSNSHPAGATAT